MKEILISMTLFLGLLIAGESRANGSEQIQTYGMDPIHEVEAQEEPALPQPELAIKESYDSQVKLWYL